MSDPTVPSYYPPGWDRERMLNASDEDYLTLTDSQRKNFREGMQAHLGEVGVEAYQVEMLHRHRQRDEAAKAAAAACKGERYSPGTPLFLETLQDTGRSRTPREIEEWGFVVFRTAGYGDQARWQEMRKRWDRIIDGQIDSYLALPAVREAKEKLQFLWVEDPALDGADPATVIGRVSSVLRARFYFLLLIECSRYGAMELPFNLKHNLCLCVNEASMESILNTPLPFDSDRRCRLKIPFVLAVALGADQEAEDPDEEGADWCHYFNVAVETLLDNLFQAIEGGTMAPFEIGGRVRGDDVWCDIFRAGIHKANTGYFYRDSRRR